MTETARKRTYYGGGAVQGSLAYDFNHPELYREMPEKTARPQRETATHTAVRTRAVASVKTKQSLAPFAIGGLFVAALMLVICLSAQIRLLDISTQSAKLESQLGDLLTEQTKLKIAYESAFNYSEVEEYATKTLGMQKPQADQICYIDTASPDRTEVLAAGMEDNFVDRISDFLTGIANVVG